MPRGIFSMPKTSTQSCWPAAIAAAPSASAAPPLAQPASTLTIGTPVRPSAVEHLVTGGDAACRRCRRTRPGSRRARRPPRRARRAPRRWPSCVDVVVGEAAERMDADAGDVDGRLTRLALRSRREGEAQDLVAGVVGEQRRDLEPHGRPARSRSRRVSVEPGDDAQPLRQLDDAEAVRHRAAIAGRRAFTDGVQVERAGRADRLDRAAVARRSRGRCRRRGSGACRSALQRPARSAGRAGRRAAVKRPGWIGTCAMAGSIIASTCRPRPRRAPRERRDLVSRRVAFGTSVDPMSAPSP